jgi:hypothetical protein
MINSKLESEKAVKSEAKVNTNIQEKSKDLPGFIANPDSITYGYATNNNAPLQNAAGFISPTILEKIPINLNHPYTGVMGEAHGVKIIL